MGEEGERWERVEEESEKGWGEGERERGGVMGEGRYGREIERATRR